MEACFLLIYLLNTGYQEKSECCRKAGSLSEHLLGGLLLLFIPCFWNRDVFGNPEYSLTNPEL